MSQQSKSRATEKNLDPITGAPGSHPVGTGVGAAAGGAAGVGAAAAAGAAVAGAPVGPAGAVAGAAIGGIAGGLVGKAVVEDVNPAVEEKYWRENYFRRPYMPKHASYEQYGPAYRYGWEGRSRFGGKKFEEIELDLEHGWNKFKAECKLGWNEARDAVRDAWDRVSSKH